MTVSDPVCSMQIGEQDAIGRVEYEGKSSSFCSGGCRTEFGNDPGQVVEEGAEGE